MVQIRTAGYHPLRTGAPTFSQPEPPAPTGLARPSLWFFGLSSISSARLSYQIDSALAPSCELVTFSVTKPSHYFSLAGFEQARVTRGIEAAGPTRLLESRLMLHCLSWVSIGVPPVLVLCKD